MNSKQLATIFLFYTLHGVNVLATGSKDENVQNRIIQCYSCNSSADDSDCIHDVDRANVCETNLGKCYTFSKNDIVIRGCVGDEVVPDVNHCEDPTSCSICSNRVGCNDEKLISEVCISLVPESTMTLSTQCPLALKATGCFHMEIDGVQHRRGCVNELSKGDRIECNDATSPICKICFGDNCNFKSTFDKCLSCNSLTNPNCTSNTSSVEVKICENYDNKCYTIITDERAVQRGCCDKDKNFIKKCADENDHCDICVNSNTNVCNDKAFFNTCIMCNSSTDPFCCENPKLSKETVCTVKSTKVTRDCYIDRSDDGVSRGCFEDLDFIKQYNCRNELKNCKTCIGRNCNEKVIENVQCYICNGTQDTSCTELNEANTITCQNFSSSCFVGIDEYGNTHRGCSSTRKIDEISFKNGYDLCYNDLCNDFIVPENRLKCFQCEGNANCKNHKEKSKTCNVLIENDECYIYWGEGGEEYRGCLSDGSELCQNNKTCMRCNRSNCNDNELSINNILAIEDALHLSHTNANHSINSANNHDEFNVAVNENTNINTDTNSDTIGNIDISMDVVSNNSNVDNTNITPYNGDSFSNRGNLMVTFSFAIFTYLSNGGIFSHES